MADPGNRPGMADHAPNRNGGGGGGSPVRSTVFLAGEFLCGRGSLVGGGFTPPHVMDNPKAQKGMTRPEPFTNGDGSDRVFYRSPDQI